MKRFLLLIMVMILSIAAVGCGEEKVKVHKTLKVGISVDFPPFEYTESRDKNVKGFDIDIINAIGKEMGYEIVFQNMDFDNLLNTLELGNVDVVISGITITDERKSKVSFTAPYYESGLAIAIRDDNTNIDSFSDLPGKRVGVVPGTTSADVMREQNSIDVVEIRTTNDAFHSLMDGKIDAVINDRPVIDFYLTSNEGINVKSLPVLIRQEYYGIAIKKENTELKEDIDDALQKIKDKGVYNQIYAKWFGGEKIPTF